MTKEIVVVESGVPMTDTKTIAETFNKKHKDVIKKLENLGCSEGFGRRNFTPTSYTDDWQRSQPMYKMTQEGYSLVVMGFTGAKAMKFKEKYIEAFKAMTEYIQNEKAHQIPQTLSEALLLAGAQAAKNEQLLLEATVNAPKVEYHDIVKECGGGILLGSFSKSIAPEIVIGQKALFTFLRENKILQSAKGPNDISWNTPYQKYIDSGYFFIDPGTRPSTSEGFKQTATTRITGKGQIWLTKKLKRILGI